MNHSNEGNLKPALVMQKIRYCYITAYYAEAAEIDTLTILRVQSLPTVKGIQIAKETKICNEDL